MYMCLKGYDPDKISILTTYNGQKFLIRDIIHKKCAWNSFFKKPNKITTVDKFQGQQNDYILLSLVRSSHVGHLRDPRRLVVAMSRARLGIYVFGQIKLFEGFPEIKICFDYFKKHGQKLEIISSEQHPSSRTVGQKVKKGSSEVIQDYKHMYQIIQKLLNQEIEQL